MTDDTYLCPACGAVMSMSEPRSKEYVEHALVRELAERDEEIRKLRMELLHNLAEQERLRIVVSELGRRIEFRTWR